MTWASQRGNGAEPGSGSPDESSVCPAQQECAGDGFQPRLTTGVRLCREWLRQHSLQPSHSNHPADFTRQENSHVNISGYIRKRKYGQHPASH